ncbi:NVEALA domain-containing protein [Prevotella communis]|jgi:hypothetical protein|uniref:NVEALA domain-containing protein n=1 Tax=Prevotella communis TaxID=2913614 RepID=UPI001EDAB82A|nr:NVEALA domain-containing protein [Prevotella communis]UKK57270.1 NVEALA domain-containing protein [Prevotella communis]
MKKNSIKCSIAAALMVVAGFAAYQSLVTYGVQDKNLLMQNVEALASGSDTGAGAQKTNKAKKWNYSKNYNVTGWKSGINISASVRSLLANIIGTTKRADGVVAANIEKYTVYTSDDVYQEKCLEVPDANCICDPSDNNKWFKKPSFTPDWWGLSDTTCN